MPSKHLSTVRRKEAILIYTLLKGYKINVGKFIEKSVLGYSKSKCRGMIPYPATITRLCIQGGVDNEWGTKETYPRASPLTLTSIIKGPNNRGKSKVKEIEEEKGNEGCTEPQQWENKFPLQPEGQKNQSQFWNASPEIRQTH